MTDASVADTVTPPPAPQPGAAAEVLNSPPPAPAFYESFQDAGAKEWAQKAGFKSAEDVAKLAQKFDAFKDADPATLRALPKADDPNAFVAFAQEHLGAPKDAAAYGLDKIEGVDAEFAGEAGGWGAEAGLTTFQMQHLANKFVAKQKADAERMAKEDQIAGEREITQLDTEWGSEATAKKELGRRALKSAARSAGVDATEFLNYIESGAGAGAALKIAAYFGQFIKEGDFIDGDTNTPATVPLQERMYKDI
jgi:hypothetical protein